jgi:hypothetical protein
MAWQRKLINVQFLFSRNMHAGEHQVYEVVARLTENFGSLIINYIRLPRHPWPIQHLLKLEARKAHAA